jgi:hypothetical protein
VISVITAVTLYLSFYTGLILTMIFIQGYFWGLKTPLWRRFQLLEGLLVVIVVHQFLCILSENRYIYSRMEEFEFGVVLAIMGFNSQMRSDTPLPGEEYNHEIYPPSYIIFRLLQMLTLILLSFY